MGFEIRKQPKGWRHPVHKGSYIPLKDGNELLEEQADWDRQNELWEKGIRETGVFSGNITQKPVELEFSSLSFEEWTQPRPEEKDYSPVFEPEELTHIVLYENITEGTPLCPPFETPEAMAAWLVENYEYKEFGNSSYGEWLSIIKRLNNS